MLTKIQSEFANRAIALKKIKVDDKDVKTVVNKLFTYIRYFNSIPADAEIIWHRPISEIKIISEFADFILPASVRLDSSDKAWSDLLNRALVSEDDIKSFRSLNYSEFVELQMIFRGYFKSTINDNFKTFSECRRNLNLSDVLSYASINGKVWYTGKPFIPIPLKPEVAFLDSRGIHYCVDESFVIEEYLADLTF